MNFLNRSSPHTLANLSLNTDYLDSPLFWLFRHAFFDIGSKNEGEAEGNFDGHPIEEYANTIVNDLFALSAKDIETEAALVMNVWMAVANELYKTLDHCKGGRKNFAANTLDHAVSYWVGAEQTAGSNEEGHMLYNLAEIAGARFGQDNGEVITNTALLAIFIDMQNVIQGGGCGVDDQVANLRTLYKRAIGLITVPLVQNLIHHISNVANESGSDFVELYALAVIPRIASCDPSSYNDLLSLSVLKSLSANDARPGQRNRTSVIFRIGELPDKLRTCRANQGLARPFRLQRLEQRHQ